MRFLDATFDRFRWYRRLIGGHWEQWNVDSPVNGLVWHRLRRCTREVGGRPSGLCRGTPVCENYPR